MKQSTKIWLPTLFVGNASIIYIVFYQEISSAINNAYVSGTFLILSALGLFFTIIFNIFGGGWLNRKFIYYYVNEPKVTAQSKQPWEK